MSSPDPRHRAGIAAIAAIEMRGIDKRFGAVHAVCGADLSVRSGSIHGLIGENGAGKSTLMSILYGFYTADAGDIAVRGIATEIPDSHAAIRAGIAMVHQHFMLIDTLGVLDNVMLGVEGGAVLARHRRAARADLERLSREYGLGVDPDAIVGDLPVGARQRVEILKALHRGAEILILDEPTGVLTPGEAADLFRVLDALRAQGKTVLIVTHKLAEILAITDRVSVMRAGAMVAHRETCDTSADELARLMIGRALAPLPARSGAAGQIVLELADARVRDLAGVTRLADISLSVRAGEIVGIAGVSGNGQTELLEAIAGMRPLAGGAMRVLGEPAPSGDPAAMRALGVGHVPEDRLRTGLLPRFAARESALLGHHDDPALSRGPWLNWPAIDRHSAMLMEAYDVRPRATRLRTSLFSGGNQQKLVLGREAERSPVLLLVGQPTRGVDIGGIEAIHRRLLALRDAGCAILLVSVELDEVRALSDRILVMCGGRIVGETSAQEADEFRLGRMMAGIAA